MPRAVIIDDERLARAELRMRLEAHPEVTVVGEAATLAAARDLLRTADYDLVFMDVQLPGGTGFDLVPEVRRSARVIFVTAHDRFAFHAFEVNALDYLRKPVRAPRLAEALARAPAAHAAPQPVTALDDLLQVKTGAGARFIRIRDIVAITSDDNYSEVLLAPPETVVARQTLSSWEERLPPSHFMRVHRTTIVNFSRIEGFTHQTSEVTLLRLAGAPKLIPARRHHLPELTRRLTALGVRP